MMKVVNVKGTGMKVSAISLGRADIGASMPQSEG